jgi:hypothetical protein
MGDHANSRVWQWIGIGTAMRIGPVDRTGRDTILRPSPTPPPNRAATVSGMRRGFGLEVAAIGLLVIACTAGPSGRPSPSEAASLFASPGPTVAVSSTPAPTASASASPVAESLPNVRTTALGEVTGNWLFYDVQIPRPERNGVEVQIVAVPAGGGAATTVVAFDGEHPKASYLRRQFSPDGRRMVLSINGQLVVIDLATGQAKPLGVQGLYPSWSRDGSQIAFAFINPEPSHPGYAFPVIGIVPAAGGSPRALASVQSDGGFSVEWSPDGSQIFVYYPPLGPCNCVGAHVTMEVASGRIGPTQIARVSGAHWRVGSPELAVAIQTCGQPADERIVGIDVRTGRERTLVDVTDQCTEVELRDPRWNPAVANELLYVAIGHRGTAGAATDDFEAHVVNISTGQNTRLPISAYEATWTWDGSAVAYVAKTPGSPCCFGSAVRVWRRDGSGETELRRATGGETFFSIASVNY